ncbi:SulP family inorganic anion transporter [Oerskovia sp. M15]
MLAGIGRAWPRLPAPLLVVTGGILASAFGGITERGVTLVSPIPAGLPAIVLPRLGDVPHLLPAAAAIAIMAFLESVAVAREVRNRKDPRIDPDQELLAVGAASLVGGFTAVIPAAGGFAVRRRPAGRGAEPGREHRDRAAGSPRGALPRPRARPHARGDSRRGRTRGHARARGRARVPGPDPLRHVRAVDRRRDHARRAPRRAARGVAAGVLMTLFIVLRDLDRPQIEVLRRGPDGWEPAPDRSEPHEAPTAGGSARAPRAPRAALAPRAQAWAPASSCSDSGACSTRPTCAPRSSARHSSPGRERPDPRARGERHGLGVLDGRRRARGPRPRAGRKRLPPVSHRGRAGPRTSPAGLELVPRARGPGQGREHDRLRGRHGAPTSPTGDDDPRARDAVGQRRAPDAPARLRSRPS